MDVQPPRRPCSNLQERPRPLAGFERAPGPLLSGLDALDAEACDVLPV